MAALVELGTISISGEIVDKASDSSSHWIALMTPDGACSELSRSGRCIRYPGFVYDERINSLDGPSKGKGLYVWAVRNDAGALRFVHVGISKGGASTLSRRTRTHLKGQLDCTDRVHGVTWASPDDRFGTLGPDHGKSEGARAVAQDFLARLQILYLLPRDPSECKDWIWRLEGAISHAAAYLLDQRERCGDSGWETTNDLSKHSGPGLAEEAKGAWAARISSIFSSLGTPMLPSTSRRHALVETA